MKLNSISLAIAAALSAAAGSAFALPVADYQLVAGDTAELYVSGATAQEAGLRSTLARMCAAGTLDVYQFSNQQAAFCTINKTVVTGTPASVTKMVVYKSGVGGSGNGVQPVANNTTLTFISMAALKATPALVVGPTTAIPAVAPTAPDTIGVPGYNRIAVSTTATATVAPDAGFSDVEPKLLGASTAEVGRLQVGAPNNLIFAVPVTKAARDALQTAQGLPAGSESEAAMPSLRKDLIAGAYSGAVTNWSQLGVTLADDTIYLSTRVETSGTQKSFNVYLTGAACNASAPAILASNATAADCTSAAPAGNVFAGSGSGDVLTCLAGHQSNGRGAFGVLSTEFVPETTSGGTGYRFIKIDGFAPTLTNTVNGDYDFWVEPTFQYRKAPSPAPLAGVKKTIADRILTQLGTEAVITQLDNALVQSWGRSGLLAKPSAANVPPTITPRATDATVLANPTNAFTRTVGAGPNNCLPGQFFN